MIYIFSQPPPIFYENPLSSVACGAPFQRKGAINCGKAATFPFEPSEPFEPRPQSGHPYDIIIYLS